MLNSTEIKQYNRQIILPELGLQGQQKLKAAKVLMIGAGGLGCPILQYLVAAGVGTIGIVDNDLVDTSNLHRQILYTTADVGKSKVIVAKQKLELLNPFVTLNPYQERLANENAARLIEKYDLVIDGSDNFTTRYLVNDTCVELNKPLVFGSIFKFEGHVSVFHYKNGPNYRNVFPEAPPDNEVPNCSETGVIGVLCGIIGAYMANEAIKIICDLGETLSGKLFTMSALTNSTNIFKVQGREQKVQPLFSTVGEKTTNSNDREITHEMLMDWLKNDLSNTCLIDVREPYEFEEFNIGGINIPLYELMDQQSKIPKNVDRVIFCCGSGVRSKQAAYLAKQFLKEEIFNLKNGIFIY